MTVSFNGYTFQVSLGTMSGQVMIPVSTSVRNAAGVVAGDRLTVEIELATEPAPVTIPEDLQAALAAEPGSRAFFDGLTASRQRGYTDWIEQAKKDETGERRLAQTVLALRERRSRP